MSKVRKVKKTRRTQRIIALRKEKGYNTQKLAGEIGMTDTNYRHYESEKTAWGIEIVELLAKLFDVSPVYLLYGREKGVPYIEEGSFYFEGDTTCMDEETAKMLELWSSASDENRDKIIRMIEMLIQ